MLLLQAGAEILGGEAELAAYMDIDELDLRAYLDGRKELPRLLGLYAVDLVIGNRAFARTDPAALDRAIGEVLLAASSRAA
ncbi:MAG TPA: hypothetical protein VIV54_19265 [Burkholderiales bacterium]